MRERECESESLRDRVYIMRVSVRESKERICVEGGGEGRYAHRLS